MKSILAAAILATTPAAAAESPYPYTTYRHEHRISPGSSWQTVSLPDPYGHYTPIAVAMPEEPTAYAAGKNEYQLAACGSTARVRFREGRVFVRYQKKCDCRATTQRPRTRRKVSVRALISKLRCRKANIAIDVQVQKSCGCMAPQSPPKAEKPALAPPPEEVPAPAEPEA